jgi:hypothetical protein
VHRTVHNIAWAKECESKPFMRGPRRVTGTRAKGISYERTLAKTLRATLPGVRHGQWFVYHADGNLGYCQTDFIRLSSGCVHVLECKLSNVEEATEQFLDLYFPILKKVYALPVYGIIVTKSVHRVPDLAHITSSLSEALRLAETRVPVLHWLGRGPL